jgi:hypothetical protein
VVANMAAVIFGCARARRQPGAWKSVSKSAPIVPTMMQSFIPFRRLLRSRADADGVRAPECGAGAEPPFSEARAKTSRLFWQEKGSLPGDLPSRTYRRA